MTAKEYNTCVDLYSDRLYRFVVKNLRHQADSEDIMQLSFEVLWKNRTKVSIEKARAYLFSVAHNKMIDHIRKNKRINHVETIPESESVYTSDVQQFDLSDVISESLQRLSEVQRAMILLRDYEGYSYKEVADLTQHSESQVKVYIFRARKKMKQYLISIDKVI